MPTSEELRELLRSSAFPALFDLSPELLVAYDPSGHLLDCNQAVLDRVGVTRDKLTGHAFARYVVEEDKQRAHAAFAQALAAQVTSVKVRATLPTGEHSRVSMTLIPVSIEGSVIAVLLLTTDIESIERERTATEHLQKQYDGMVRSIHEGFYIFDSEFTVRYLNPQGEGIAHRAADSVLGRNLWAEFPGLYGSEFGIAYRQAVADQVKVMVRDSFQDLGWLEAIAYPTDDGGLAVYVRDVTDEEVTRQQLAEAHQRVAAQAALLDVAHDAIIVYELNHHIRYWNAGAARIYGWSAEEAVGRSARELLYVEWTEFDEAARHTLSDGEWVGELLQVTKAGATIVADTGWTLVRDADGIPESYFTVGINITERKRQDDIVMRNQRIDSLGNFASGIAHDLNNVLTPILISSQILAMEESDATRLQLLAAIETGASRGADMVHKVLSFVRGAEGRLTRVDVSRLMNEFEGLCIASMPSVTVILDLDANLSDVPGDPTQLLQVLMNLATNARDAMNDSGTLRISARNETVTAASTGLSASTGLAGAHLGD